MRLNHLGPAVKTYLLHRKEPGRYWEELEKRFERHIIPKLGGENRSVVSITKSDILKIIDEKWGEGKPVAARTLYESLNPFFKWCLGRDIIVVNPLTTVIPPRVPKSRDRVLEEEELKAIWEATKAMGLWGPFVRFLTMTLQRRNEVAGIKKEEIYVSSQGIATWTIPGSRTKNGKTQVVPITEEAKRILDSKPEFLGRGLSGFSKAKARLDRLSGVTDWRLHDLRRTGATYLQGFGIEPQVIEAILNHRPKGVQGVYQRYKYLEERRYALGLWSIYLEGLDPP